MWVIQTGLVRREGVQAQYTRLLSARTPRCGILHLWKPLSDRGVWGAGAVVWGANAWIGGAVPRQRRSAVRVT